MSSTLQPGRYAVVGGPSRKEVGQYLLSRPNFERGKPEHISLELIEIRGRTPRQLEDLIFGAERQADALEESGSVVLVEEVGITAEHLEALKAELAELQAQEPMKVHFILRGAVEAYETREDTWQLILQGLESDKKYLVQGYQFDPVTGKILVKEG